MSAKKSPKFKANHRCHCVVKLISSSHDFSFVVCCDGTAIPTDRRSSRCFGTADRRGGSRGALTTSPPRIPVRSYSSTETRTKVRRVPPPEKSQQGFFHGLFFFILSQRCVYIVRLGYLFGNPTGSQLLMCNVGNTTMLGAYPVQSGSALKMSPNHEVSLLFFSMPHFSGIFDREYFDFF